MASVTTGRSPTGLNDPVLVRCLKWVSLAPIRVPAGVLPLEALGSAHFLAFAYACPGIPVLMAPPTQGLLTPWLLSPPTCQLPLPPQLLLT